MKKFIRNLIELLYKISPFLTLLFIVYSYYNSVKPVFDKTKELNESKILVLKLNEQIKSKEFKLDSVSLKEIELAETVKQLKAESSALNIQKEKQQADLLKIGNELNIKENDLNNARKSAIRAHLTKIKEAIVDEEFRNVITGKEFDIKKYIRTYIDEIEPKDEFEKESITIMNKYLAYKGEYDLEHSIYYLIIYYDYVYDK
jgi:hypothetical protein